MFHDSKILVKRLVKMNLLIIVFLTAYFCTGQNKAVIDSLETLLEVQENDTSKVHTLNELAWEYRKINPKKATDYANGALRLSSSLSFSTGTITGLNRLGMIAIYQKKFIQAERIYLDILEKEKIEKNLYGIARAENQLGIIYKNLGDLPKSLIHYQAGLDIFEDLNKVRQVAQVANNLGAVYRRMGNYDKALEYFLESSSIWKNLESKKGMASSFLNLGGFYNVSENFKEAIRYLSQSEVLYLELQDEYQLAKVYNNLGNAYYGLEDDIKALEFYEKALFIKKKYGLGDADSSTYHNLGALYHRANNFPVALNYYEKSISIQESMDEDVLLIDSKTNVADVIYRTGEYKKAIKIYEEVLELAERSSKDVARLKILDGLALSYSKLDEYDKALAYSRSYIRLKDSIETKFIDATNIRIEYDKKQKEVELLQKNNEIARSHNKFKNTLIYALGFGFLLALLLFFSILRGNKQKQKAQLAEKNRQIEQKNVQELLNRQEIKFNQARLEGQEKERTRIAKELHDRLGSMLSMIKVHYKSVEEHIEQLRKSNKIQYQKANSMLDEACEEVRKIANDLNSGVLSKFGLVAALEDLAATLNNTNQISVDFNAHGLDDRLNAETEVTIFRIVQELINNILKHASAKEITVQLLQSEKGLNIMVEDDGVGFDLKNQKNTGMGLNNVAHRVDKLYGLLNIDTSLGNGTTVTIDIPLKEISE